MAQPELMEVEFHLSGGVILQRNFDFQFLRLSEFPASFCLSSLRVLNAQGINTHGAGRLQMKCVFAANDQCAFLGRWNAPVSGTGSPQMKVWAVKPLESPKPVQCASDFRIELCRIKSMGVDLKAAACGRSLSRKIQRAYGFALNTQHKIVRNIRGVDERGALDRQDQGRLLQAVHLLGIGGAQGRELWSLYCGQSD